MMNRRNLFKFLCAVPAMVPAVMAGLVDGDEYPEPIVLQGENLHSWVEDGWVWRPMSEFGLTPEQIRALPPEEVRRG